MSDIRQWLEGVGLERYAEAFEENEVMLDLARDLTDTDLEKLGVAILGHRKTLLRAIDKLGDPQPQAEAEPGESAAALDQTGAPPGAEAAPREAERRQLTVMFCDLVGSTALSEQLDPEDLRILMQAYQQAAGAVIARYEGHVAQYLGDGLMTYFGWPQAHEDDAERAVRAALEIVAAVKGVEAPSPLEIRVGIATGAVVVGETGGGDASVPQAAVGETPNLAARAQGLAGADEIVIVASTRRLVGATFELDDLGAQALKGIVEPVRLFRVGGIAEAEDRFAARGARLTPLVGREAEIALVLGRWEQARTGEGQVVLLSGEAGIGKSRITQVLRERVAEEPHTRLRYQCSPYHTNSALYPVIEQIERAAGFARGDDTDAKLDKLEAVLGEGTVVPLIAAMLSLDIARYPALAMSPQKQKEETLKALADAVTALAAMQPVLMIFEDAHWIDPTTQELLDVIVPAVAENPVLLVITYRPEYAPPWLGLGHVVPVALTRLGRAQSATMVERVTGGKPLPDEVLDQIVAKTDGVPLFVEELTKTVLEAGFLKEESDAYVLDGPLAPLAIPATLQDSLMARLDRLSTVKEVAQIGACIGREFSYEFLAAISPLNDNALHDALQQLVNAELIFSRGSGPEASYTFKHALVQDAAYESLLKSRRQQLHTRLADVLLETPGMAETMPELLAHHYTKADMPQQAVRFWLAAGQLATERSANVEAISHLNQGLASLAGLPDTPERDRQELALQVASGIALIMTKGYAAEETETAYVRAHTLCGQLDNPTELFQVLYGLFAYRWVRAELAEARDAAEDFLRVAQDQGNCGAEVVAERTVGAMFAATAKFGLARMHLERTLALYEREAHSSLAFEYAQDPAVAAAAYLSTTLWMLGFPEQARDRINVADRYAREIAHPQTLVYLLTCGTSWLHMFQRDPATIRTCAAESISIATEQAFPYWSAYAKIVGGWATAYQDEPRAGVAAIVEGIRQFRSTGGALFLPVFSWALADAHRVAGNAEEGLTAIRDGLASAEGSGELWWHAELHRLRGVLLLESRRDAVGDAEAAFRAAIAIAREQCARSWQLRAATSLAGLWQSQGKIGDARDLLAPVYGWFTEGFDTADLKDAKALLEELK